MSAAIYVGTLSHTRISPVKHHFRYPLYCHAFDLAELDELDRRCAWFGHNRLRPVSLWDRDYLGPEGALYDKALDFLRRHVPGAGPVDRIRLLTAARHFNYVFNPVSFFYFHDPQGRLRYVLAEVNNTFKETHVYLLAEPLDDAGGFLHFRAKKDFHVSPMFDREGAYEFFFRPLDETLDVRMQLVKGGLPVFTAQLRGTARPFDDRHLRRTIARYPVTAAITMPRIMWQAARLHVQRRLPVYDKPVPTSPMTIKTAPARPFQRWAARRVLAAFDHLEGACLELELPDGTACALGNPGAKPRQRVRVRDDALFSRVLLAGDLGLGEGYVRGEWEAEDLTGTIRLFIERVANLERPLPTLLPAFAGRLARWRQRNTRAGSRRNIARHYDLSNDFYRLFLDGSLTYSCAVYARPDEPLEDAQLRKLRLLIDKARIRAHHHVLEIGCGWGGFAIEAARQTGCRVTAITVSRAQHELARARVAAAGLEDRIDVRLCDYRTVTGRFDRIVSIEMLEAVGHAYLPAYFRAVGRLLAPDGLAVLQTITIPDHLYARYRRGFDWMQKHIFPGSHLPSLGAIAAALARHTKLHVEHLENIGPHYAPTLAAWRTRFERAESDVAALGFDEAFYRKWRFYLAFCEAAFAARALNNLQLVLTRSHNATLAPAWATEGAGDQAAA